MGSSSRPNSSGSPNMSPELIDKFLDIQKENILLEAQQYKLEEKNIDNNFKLAQKNLEYQREFLLKSPKQNRWTILLISSVIIAFVVIILMALFIFLRSGFEEYANTLLQSIVYLAVFFTGIFTGRKWEKSKSPKKYAENIEDIPA